MRFGCYGITVMKTEGGFSVKKTKPKPKENTRKAKRNKKQERSGGL